MTVVIILNQGTHGVGGSCLLAVSIFPVDVKVSPTAFPAYQDSTVMAERSFRNLAQMSGLDLNDLIDANNNGELKSLLQEEVGLVLHVSQLKRIIQQMIAKEGP